MNKVTEIIPDNLPEWAKNSIDNGTFFKTAVEKATDFTEASDIDLLKELINRNKMSQAPVVSKRHGEWFAVTVAVGDDNTAEITLTDDAVDYLGL